MRKSAFAICGIIALTLVTRQTFSDPPETPRVGKLPAGKLLFLGNSITLHGPAPKIGWTGNWGMAATDAERDYVHLVTQAVKKATGKSPETKVANIADFERRYADYDVAKSLKAELAFRSDIVIVAIGENVPGLANAKKKQFAASFARLLAALKANGNPAIFVRSSFWADPAKDGIMKKACEEAGGTFVDIGALGKDETNFARAERKIDHAGVAAHPGNKGMEKVADAIWTAISKRAE